ncbi:MAG: molybdenum cofactor biosynthesis protein MoaE [Candidatus Kariarchaeaceae archaeon]|jgi:molybdopterin synthase catalytic subunit
MMDFEGWIAEAGSISLEDIISSLKKNENSGAITTFTGQTRKISDKSQKKVVSIEIETWAEKSDQSMKKIATELGEKYNLLGVRIVHLTGNIELGEPIVYIVLSSIHRKEAFDAMEEAINRYKNESPVWKKEIYEDGTGEWITTQKLSSED